MKSSDIRACIEVNPEARFALKPTANATAVTIFSHVTEVGRSKWEGREHARPSGYAPRTYSAQSLCTVEDAQRQVDETIARNAARSANRRKSGAVAAQLKALGINARPALGGVLILGDNVDALAGLFDERRKTAFP